MENDGMSLFNGKINNDVIRTKFGRLGGLEKRA